MHISLRQLPNVLNLLPDLRRQLPVLIRPQNMRPVLPLILLLIHRQVPQVLSLLLRVLTHVN